MCVCVGVFVWVCMCVCVCECVSGWVCRYVCSGAVILNFCKMQMLELIHENTGVIVGGL